MIISIDGIDGIGKTTICKLIQKKIGGEIIHINVSQKEQVYFDSLKLIESKFMFWFQKFIETYHDMEFNLDMNYIVDRSIYSNIIYHKLLGSKLNIQNFELLIPNIDYKFYLTTDYNTWKKRFCEKKTFDFYEKIINESKDFKNKLEKEYTILNFIKINNDTKNEAIKQITNHLL